MSRSLPEWIGKTPDSTVPPRVQDRVRQKDGNACRGCGRPLANESAECDHAKAIINGGENRESNLQTLCLWCHGKKTKSDVAEKSATYRKRRAHHGIKSARPSFGTNRNAPFKKKMTGEVVRRLCR